MTPTGTAQGLPQREQWVDTLRVVLIAGVIVVHTATAYVADFAGFYYDDERDAGTVLSVAFALPALLGGIFGLGPLFVVAGWFSVSSLRRSGAGHFVARRLLRLGVPLLFFVLVVNPLADYLGNLWQEDTSPLGYLAVTEFSVMWFVVALLVCSLGYAGLRSLRPRVGRGAPPGPRSLVVAAAAIAVGSLAVWQATTLLDTHLLNVRVSAWTQALVLFALGALVAEAGGDGRVSRDAERRLGRASLAAACLTLALLGSAGARDELDATLGGLNAASATFAVLYGIASVTFSLWCLAWVRRRWPTHGPWMARAARGSYATYVAHPVVLVLVMLAFRPVPLGPELKFLLVAAVAVPVCFAVGYAATRIPGLGRVV